VIAKYTRERAWSVSLAKPKNTNSARDKTALNIDKLKVEERNLG
jgi:hypothetical protein